MCGQCLAGWLQIALHRWRVFQRNADQPLHGQVFQIAVHFRQDPIVGYVIQHFVEDNYIDLLIRLIAHHV